MMVMMKRCEKRIGGVRSQVEENTSTPYSRNGEACQMA